MVKSRRGRIIELLSEGFTDEEIIQTIDVEFPLGTFSTSNMKALYGTKWDLGKTKNQRKPHKSNRFNKPKGRSKPSSEYDRSHLINLLRHFDPKPTIDRYRKTFLLDKNTGEILADSVDNTIYRAFRYETPSKRYLNWRWHKAPEKLIDELDRLSSQSEYDDFLYEVGHSLVSDWGKNNDRGEPTKMNIGVAMKITNLVMKHLSFSSNVNNRLLIDLLHIPWDSYTLKPLRRIGHFDPPIPASPTQGFVNNLKLYKELHALISEIAKLANQPRISYEFFVWDLEHQKTTS
jgi:hypothetical protein